MNYRITLLTTMLISLFLVVGLITIYQSLKKPIMINEINGEIAIDFKVGDAIGFNVDTDAIHFGTLKKGSGSIPYRYFTVSNNGNISRFVNFTLSENMGAWVKISANHFILQPGENKQLKAELDIPSGLMYGTYNGTLKTSFREVR